jgi:hypothetical protein
MRAMNRAGLLMTFFMSKRYISTICDVIEVEQ